MEPILRHDIHFRRLLDDAMAPRDKTHLLFRWEFVPIQNPLDGSIRWAWRAYTQTGTLVMESDCTFEGLTECIEDAKARGYANP
jgi:hypothetical protein